MTSAQSPNPRWSWLLCLLVLVPALPLLLQTGVVVQHDIFASDLLHSHLPYRAFIGRTLASGHLPLWFSDVFSGCPLWSQVEAGAAYPPHLLLFALFSPLVALNLAIVLELLTAAFGMRALARQLGSDAWGAALAGLAFAWCGFMVSHTRHPNMHAAAALLPWMLLALERLLASRGRSWGPTLCLLVGLQVSAGHPQISYICLLLVMARAATAWPGAARDWARQLLAAGAACGLGLALLAVQLLPSWLFTRAAMGQVDFSWDYARAYPLLPQDLLALLWPPLVGSMEGYDYQGAGSLPWGNYGYAGALTLLLAVAAVPLLRRRRAPRFYASAALVSLLLALGDATPLFELAWSVVPGMGLFRFANRFLLPLDLGLALLAGLALAALIRRLGPRAGLALGLGALLLCLVDLDHHQGLRMPMDRRAEWSRTQAPQAWGSAQDGTGRYFNLDEFSTWERAFHAAQGFNKGTGPYRLAWQVPIGSSGSLQGLRSASGYTRMIHHRAATFWQQYERPSLYGRLVPPHREGATGPLTPQLRALLDRGSVSLVLAAVPLQDPGLLPLGQSPLFSYRNEAALPRAYLATRWSAAESAEQAARWIFREGLGQLEVPVVEGAASSSAQAPASLLAAEVQEQGPNRMLVTLPAAAPAGLLVLSDSWDEGWSAWVDGEPAELLIANGYQRGVLLGAGARRVELRYLPQGLGMGALLSLLALLAVAAWAGWARWRRRGRELP